MHPRFATALLLPLIAMVGVSCVIPAIMEGTGMQPTLKDGDRWFISTNVSGLQRGDIVSFRYPKDESKRYIKRIVGLPGEELEIRSGTVFISGSALKEDYLDQQFNQSGGSYPPVKIKQNHYFVLGDNRDNSSDSRYWGTVDSSLIEGRLYARYWSASKD